MSFRYFAIWREKNLETSYFYEWLKVTPDSLLNAKLHLHQK